jgi:hypothetical protein
MKQIEPDVAPGDGIVNDERSAVGPRRLGKAALAVYAVGILMAISLLRDQINPDAVSYVGNARHIAEGRFSESVSGYWSPLLSWSMAPLIFCGVDGLLAARIVLGIGGALLIVGCSLLMRRLLGERQPNWAHAAALVLIAISAAYWATYVISPDLLLAAGLVFYFAAVLSPDLLQRRSQAVLCGAIGAVAFFAKAYALPFVLVHFPLTVLLRWLYAGRQEEPRRVLRFAGIGIVTFLVVAGPWIAALSVKYGKPTFSTVARIAHTVIGPKDKPRYHPLGDLHEVPAGHIHVWETPEALSYNHWSPLDNLQYFVHQAAYTLGAIQRVIRDVGSFDLLYLSIPALLLPPLLIARRKDRDGAFLAIWFLTTVAIFALGFTLVFYERRYIVTLLWPMTLIYCLAFCLEKLQLPRRKAAALAVLALVSFGMYSFSCCQTVWKQGRIDYGGYRRLAAVIEPDCGSGPIAYAGRRHEGLYLAYHMNKPFLGWMWTPKEDNVGDVEAALRQHGAKTFLVDSDWKLAADFAKRTHWQLRKTIQYSGSSELRIFAAPSVEAAGVADSAPPGQNAASHPKL